MPKTCDEFKVHRLNDVGFAKADELAQIFSEALTKISAIVPAGRDRSLVIVKLQEACFFAKRGIATDPSNQVPEVDDVTYSGFDR